MSHPFGDVLSQHLHRKHGLSQSKLAAGILQEPTIITKMCKGERLTGPQARERVLAIAGWLNAQAVLGTADEANALLIAAGMAPLRSNEPAEAVLLRKLIESEQPLALPAASTRQIRLPTPPTPFVGRREDLDAVERHLSDPRCRLLTLLGLGGVGKTRLAIEAAAAHTRAYANGVCFVDLQPIVDADGLPLAIADALQFALSGNNPPHQQLAQMLANKHLLLVLDNFEHLIDAASQISGLIAAAPKLQLLITSREALNLSEEWQYRISGIAYPPKGAIAHHHAVAKYDAVRLFVDCAQRVQPAFALADTAPDVTRVCQLTEGMPLAIEMAAAWTKALPCADIAQELERSLAFLSSSLRNAPPRHKSMEAVFEHSWRLLSTGERAIFSRLAVFRGGFTREAAAHVVGAGLSELSSLVDKSFLQIAPNGRYKVHELLRQFGEERLAESANDLAHTRAQHARYYSHFLANEAKPHHTQHQLSAMSMCRDEVDNLRTAWRWSVQQCDLETICSLATAHYWLAQYHSNYLEGYNMLNSAALRLFQEPENYAVAEALVEVLPCLAWLALRLGRFDECKALAQTSLDIERRHNVVPIPTGGYGALSVLSVVAATRGDYAQAEVLAQRERERVRARKDWPNTPVSCWAFANAVLAQGRSGEAREAINEAIDVCCQSGERWILAYCYNVLGSIALAEGKLDEASTNQQYSFELREQFGDAEGMAVALNSLGEIDIALNKPASARQRYAQSLELYRDLNDRGGSAATLMGLGDAASKQGQYSDAERHYRQALQLALEINFVSLLLKLFLAIGDLFVQTQRQAQCAPLFTLVLHHPGSDEAHRSRARDRFIQLGVAETPPQPNTNWQALLTAEAERLALLLRHTSEVGGAKSHASA